MTFDHPTDRRARGARGRRFGFLGCLAAALAVLPGTAMAQQPSGPQSAPGAQAGPGPQPGPQPEARILPAPQPGQQPQAQILPAPQPVPPRGEAFRAVVVPTAAGPVDLQVPSCRTAAGQGGQVRPGQLEQGGNAVTIPGNTGLRIVLIESCQGQDTTPEVRVLPLGQTLAGFVAEQPGPTRIIGPLTVPEPGMQPGGQQPGGQQPGGGNPGGTGTPTAPRPEGLAWPLGGVGAELLQAQGDFEQPPGQFEQPGRFGGGQGVGPQFDREQSPGRFEQPGRFGGGQGVGPQFDREEFGQQGFDRGQFEQRPFTEQPRPRERVFTGRRTAVVTPCVVGEQVPAGGRFGGTGVGSRFGNEAENAVTEEILGVNVFEDQQSAAVDGGDEFLGLGENTFAAQSCLLDQAF